MKKRFLCLSLIFALAVTQVMPVAASRKEEVQTEKANTERKKIATKITIFHIIFLVRLFSFGPSDVIVLKHTHKDNKNKGIIPINPIKLLLLIILPTIYKTKKAMQ